MLTGQNRGYLLVVFFDFRLLYNLNAAGETVGSNAMSQVRFTGRRIYGQCSILELVV